MTADDEHFVEEYKSAAEEYGNGTTFMEQFDYDEFSRERTDNLYYPFASKAEWELASFLLRSDLSMKAIDTFLRLELVRLTQSLLTILSLTFYSGSIIESIFCYGKKTARTSRNAAKGSRVEMQALDDCLSCQEADLSVLS